MESKCFKTLEGELYAYIIFPSFNLKNTEINKRREYTTKLLDNKHTLSLAQVVCTFPFLREVESSTPDSCISLDWGGGELTNPIELWAWSGGLGMGSGPF